MKKGKLFSKPLWSILTGVSALLLAAAIAGTYVAINLASAALNMMFGTSNFQSVDDPNAEPSYFFRSSYENVNGDVLFDEDGKIIEEAEGEGAVLLWNKSLSGKKALPLAAGAKVSLFGRGSTETVLSGSGSGYAESVSQATGKDVSIDLKTAFESRSLEVNGALWNLLSTTRYSSPTRPNEACTEWRRWYVKELPWTEYAGVSDSFADYGDVAVVVLSRTGGEYSDLHYNYKSATATDTMESTPEEGGYLSLTDEEEAIFQNIREYRQNHGIFQKVVVLLNTGNPLPMQDLEKYYDVIDSCMWIGQIGTTGANAVADLLVGNKNPSGRLTDTFAYDLNSAPATVNDGSYLYSNKSLVDPLVAASGCASNRYNSYLVYQEGIYVGYKYYETRYMDALTDPESGADSVKGAKHSQNGWNYDEEVAYPFGYGLSYTTFSYEDFSVSDYDAASDSYTVSVTVKNTGDVAGKEVVQVYLQKPYTAYDKQYGIEKSAIELVGFAKTSLLAKGEKEKVTVTVSKERFKTYDAENKKTYIVEGGDYYLSVGTDAHVALNNVLKAKSDMAAVTQSVMGGQVKAALLGADFAKKITLSDDFSTYSKSTQTGVKITNRLDRGDIDKYENAGGNSVTYLSRNDWDSTYPVSAPSLFLHSEMVNDLKDASTNRAEMKGYIENGVPNPYYPDCTQTHLPYYGRFVSGGDTPDVSRGDAVAFMFMDAPLDPEREKGNQTVIDGKVYADYWKDKWDQLLDQMTFEEQALLCANAYHQLNGAASIALPSSKQENGPVGITKRKEAVFSLPNKDVKDWNWVAYPCAPVLASTFNVDLIRRVGEHKSEDMLYLGYNGIYGPGVNMHRTPFGGRNFEYPSEDSFLAGEVGYYESVGIESKGCMAYAKHFALNDTETNRRHVQIWSNEQATREVYLTPFERTFDEGGASATMNSFTRVGTRWSGSCYALMTEILREEWGWDGINISDWQQSNPGPMTHVDGILAGTDSFDGNSTASVFEDYKDCPAVAQAIRTSAKRIIYNVVRTNAMNGKSITSRVVKVVPWWQTALYCIDGALGVITLGCGAMTVASFVLGRKSKKTQESAL